MTESAAGESASEAKTIASQAPTTGERRSRVDWLDLATRYSLVAVLVLVFTAFSIALPDQFFTRDNILGMLNNQVIILIVAMGTVFPLVVGEFDLSVGNIVGFSQVVAIGLMAKSSLSIPVAVLIALLAATGAGLANGILLTYFRASSLIATLATGSVLLGLTYWYTGGQTLFSNIPVSFTHIARDTALGIQLPIYYAAALAIVTGILLTFTLLGRRLHAVGGNRRAAALVGIRVPQAIIFAFIASGLIAGIAGVVIGSRLGTGDPALGPDLMLPAYAGSFLGATAFRPGRFNIPGTVVAVYLLAVATTGLQIYGVPSWSTDVFNGAALAIAVGLSTKVADFQVARARRLRLRSLNEELESQTASAAAADGGA
jgi:ribose transport system permease protein